MRLNQRGLLTTALTIASVLGVVTPSTAANLKTVRVTIENLAPVDGTVITPLWVGFHNGSFDSFDVGGFASDAIERLAEDGNTQPISQAFSNSGFGSQQATLLGTGLPGGGPPVIAQGTTASEVFTLDGDLDTSRYFSYGAMIVPSNDAFIGNADPVAFRIFDDAGNFLGADFTVTGERVWDAGTEANDEVPENTALLGQTAANTGVLTSEAIARHSGFIPGGNILTAFPNADFTTPNSPSFQVARIRVEQVSVPESSMMPGLLILGGALILTGVKRRNI